jgi:hypothetical protein
MWVAGVFVSYLLTALCIPVALTLAPVWRRALIPREVRCPELGCAATLTLDRIHAVRLHAIGDQGLKVAQCSVRAGSPDCRQDCLVQIAAV